MKKPRSGWNGVPARVRKELGIRARAFYSDRVSSHGPIRVLGEQIPWRITAFWQGSGNNESRLLPVGRQSGVPMLRGVKSGFANFDRVRLL